MKQYKGQIKVWGRYASSEGYAYAVSHWYNHPEFGTRKAGGGAHTSLVTKDDCDKPRHSTDGYEIETLNSRYTVVPNNWEPSDKNEPSTPSAE